MQLGKHTVRAEQSRYSSVIHQHKLVSDNTINSHDLCLHRTLVVNTYKRRSGSFSCTVIDSFSFVGQLFKNKWQSISVFELSTNSFEHFHNSCDVTFRIRTIWGVISLLNDKSTCQTDVIWWCFHRWIENWILNGGRLMFGCGCDWSQMYSYSNFMKINIVMHWKY